MEAYNEESKLRLSEFSAKRESILKIKDDQDYRIMNLERELNDRRLAAEEAHIKYCRMSD